MSTFDLLVKKIINIENNIFSPKYYNDNICFIDKVFLSSFLFKINNKNKFIFLQKVNDNFYYKDNANKINNCVFLFNKIQKIYHILNKLIIRYKYKKSKIIIDTDLHLNNINIHDKNVICILHNGLKYLFKINDILKIIYTSLTNSYLFFSQLLPIKNPYNNIPFGKSILYYIYYFFTNNITIYSIKNEYIDVFLKFKECNFNMTKFVNKYEHIIRDYSIKNYINNSTKQELRLEINHMLNLFNSNKEYNKQINIDKEFPNDELIKIMTPYLYLKMLSEYSLVNLIKSKSIIILNKKLIEFQRFNPKFGKKIFKIKYATINGQKKICETSYTFINDHKKFNIHDINCFMNNHLAYKEDNYFMIDDDNSDLFNGISDNNELINSTYIINNNNSNSSNHNNNITDSTVLNYNIIVNSIFYNNIDDNENENDNDNDNENDNDNDNENDNEYINHYNNEDNDNIYDETDDNDSVS